MDERSSFPWIRVLALLGIAVGSIAGAIGATDPHSRLVVPLLIVGILCFLGAAADGSVWAWRRQRAIQGRSANDDQPTAHDTPRLTGDEAAKIALTNYWGQKAYKASSTWNADERRAYLYLECRDAGLLHAKVTVTDGTRTPMEYEFGTHANPGERILAWFPDDFRTAPSVLVHGDYSVTWDVLLSGGDWATADTSEFRIPHSDTTAPHAHPRLPRPVGIPAPNSLRVSGEPDPDFTSPRCRASHRVDADQVVLSLENTHHLDLPTVRCRVMAFGNKDTMYDCDVTNPFKETKETRVGPAKLECRFPQQFTGMRYAARVDAVLRPGVDHFVWWSDSFDENLTSPLAGRGVDGVDHRLAIYQFRTVV